MVRPPVNPDDAVVQELREAGLRVTMPRQAVLTWLTRHPHSTADAIAAGVRGKAGSLSLQAIYGVVTACTEAGLLRRIEPAGHPARYERRVGDNHHHLVCRRCGRTEDVDCATGERPCLEPADTQGFTIDEAEVVFWGLCAPCAAAVGPGAGTHYHEEEWH
ncbi:MAG: transcriptional repressor [Actinomycetota bacterium]|nr:transcriptional repressor [Actinomycetota bacterium]